ncbi:MAG: aspartate aminotransferase family protein [Verrucomicrobiales bacterium]
MLPHIATTPPGPKSKALADDLKKYEAPTVTLLSEQWPIFWQRSEGINVWDADGNRYLDTTSGFGVATLGHGAMAEVLSAQSRTLLHAMGDVHPAADKARLLKSLSELTFERWGFGPAKTLLGNSGSEAIEIAMKTAMLFTGLPGVLVFEGAYHGLTYGALAGTRLPFFEKPFRKQLPAFVRDVPFPSCLDCPWGETHGHRLGEANFPNCCNPCLEKIGEAIRTVLQRGDVGAILVEPIQGRAGDRIPPKDFLRLLRQICDEEKVLLIFDEIYTGWNRTGKLFACDHSGVVPDLLCVGKALTGCLPLSACVGKAEMMNAWPKSQGEALHTSTFLGHPLGCAVACASIEQHMRVETAKQVEREAQWWAEELSSITDHRVRQYRGLGLLQVLEFDPESGPVLVQTLMERGLKHGVIFLAGGMQGQCLSLSPPLGYDRDEVDYVGHVIQEILGET